MAIKDISDLTLDEITEDFLLNECLKMGTELGVDVRQGSIYRDAAAGHILRTAKFFNDLRQINDILSIYTCTGTVLDERLKERGMARNPETDTSAKYYVDFVGATPKVGDRVSCEGHYFSVGKLEERFIITSEETGSKMNILVKGLPVIPLLDVNNLISATIQELIVPALDKEDDESARQRLLDKIANQDENGNINQIKIWCESVEGVGRARVIPLWNGPNTVKAIIISQSAEVPAESIVEAVQKYIDPGADGMGEGKAAIGQIFTAASAEPIEINVRVTIIKKTEVSYERIKETLKQAIEEYCKDIALENYSEDIKIRYNRISAIITEIEGVVDHEELFVNDGVDNISFTVNQIPVLGEVVING